MLYPWPCDISSRGVQYASSVYVTWLEQVGFQVSMSTKGNPYDNAKAENFFKTLKREEVYLQDYQTFAEAEANLNHLMAAVYNAKRLHSNLGYRSPAKFETASCVSMAELTCPVVQ